MQQKPRIVQGAGMLNGLVYGVDADGDWHFSASGERPAKDKDPEDRHVGEEGVNFVKDESVNVKEHTEEVESASAVTPTQHPLTLMRLFDTRSIAHPSPS